MKTTNRLLYTNHQLRLKTKTFSLYEKTVTETQSGIQRRFFSLSAPDWVLIIMLTQNQEIVVIEQERAGIEKKILEFPGGMVDPDQTPLHTAQKEALEETGYTCQTWIPLGSFWTNPAFLDNRIHYFLGLHAEPTQSPNCEELEIITVKTYQRHRMDQFIQDNQFISALSVLGYSLALSYCDNHHHI